MFGILYTQSSYELLKNTIPQDVLIDLAVKKGYDFLALSNSNMYGTHQFFKDIKKTKLKPILGLKIKVNLDLEETHFLVYVKNDIGYHHLLKLIWIQQDRLINLQDLMTYQKGLFFVSCGLDSIIDQHILNNRLDDAYRYVKEFKESFSFYIGLSLDSFDQEMKIAPTLVKMAEKAQVKVLPLHQTSYIHKDDEDAYEALIKIDDEKNEKIKDANYAFLSKNELIELFSDYPFVFNNLKEIVKEVTYTYAMPKFDMPIYKTPEGTLDEYLRSLSIVGLKKRLKKIPHANEKVYQDRLLYELDVIHRMGFDSYFLIVFDFVRFAKTNGIFVGPGRGSAAGSLVAYCLGITDVDPITYDLLFERFLNPERITMPDIDLDFPDDKRDIVLQYVKEKYGKHHMLSIVTFGTFALRSSIRDIARVMKIDNTRVNGIISRVIKDDIDETDYEMVRLLQVAKKIEGLPRHTGTHAAGMILAEQDLTEYLPVQQGINDFLQSQYEQKDLEELGLLKIDFLGIRNLSIIDEVVINIQKEKPSFQITEIPLDDEKTYKLLQSADTSGIFQLESSGMRQVLKKLKPNTFEDLVAILALYRPGPMDNIDEYIKRRNGKPFEYIHKDLKPILETTYGIIVYQEQIMRIASDFAGYTLAEADILRRGVSKKDRQTLENEEKRFLSKSIEKGRSPVVAKDIYDYIVKFADYGFNRSHSVAYAVVAYQMAYLKAHYFPIFMTALLSNVIGNEQVVNEYLQELRRQNIVILPPHINHSTNHFIFENNAIYLPLISVKSIGRLASTKIIEERKNALYKDYQDFKLRIKKEINEKNLEMLIHSGALDVFGLNHPTMLANKQIEQAGYELYIQDFKMRVQDDFTFIEKANFEKEALGFNVLYQPHVAYKDLIEKLKLKPLSLIKERTELDVLASIKHTKVIKTKQNKQMAFITIDDGTSEMEVTLFDYDKYKDIIDKELKVFKIKKNTYREQVSYVIESIKDIKEITP